MSDEEMVFRIQKKYKVPIYIAEKYFDIKCRIGELKQLEKELLEVRKYELLQS